ncbi:MAG: glycosyltransferase family 2 protein [Hyphomicrobiales bacterium]|nr:glycosyltransferase family 2 protein [Hyphomicrobiales bacterium]
MNLNASAPELTILMPCLNEAEALGTCIEKALAYLAKSGVQGEILVADNGSTDGSQEIARKLGARVVPVGEKGYGAALIGGIMAARGQFVIMGDADDSYDFSQLDDFLAKLRQGYSLVVGNRFKGGIAPGAMPILHRWLGNPVLSFIGRTFFKAGIGDFHCGLRGFETQAMRNLNLRATGMEFASEMVVRARLWGLSIAEVPTTLKKDARSRPPHLRTWRDGWRHLRFLLMFAPRWLFFYPGLALLLAGAVVSLLLLPGPVRIAPHVSLDVHTLLVASVSTLIGTQCLSFAVVVRRYAASRGLLPASHTVERLLVPITLERVLFSALFLAIVGIGGILWCVVQWASAGFGPLHYGLVIRVLTVSVTAVAIALQLVFTAFLSAIIEMKV